MEVAGHGSSAHLETLGVAAEEARLAAAVAGGACGHHAGLREHAAAAVVAAGERDGVLLVGPCRMDCAGKPIIPTEEEE